MTVNTSGITATTPPAPRMRWAAIIWGALFAAISASGIWMLTAADRREGLTEWAASLTPTTLGSIGLLTVGALVLILGAIGLLRRSQRHSTSRIE